MSPEQFYSLPPALALRILVEGSVKLKEIVEAAEAPKTPRMPKYDQRVGRKDGFCWASEMTLSDLEWWHSKKAEGALSGGKYADRDAKIATKLEYWVQWRRVEPTTPWSGERNDEHVTARAPAGKATVYPWPDREPVPMQMPSDNYAADPSDDIPF